MIAVRGAVGVVGVVVAAALLTGCTGATGPATGAAALEVAHDAGVVELPAPATRVVTTSDETTELLVALGVQPVGVGSTRVPVAGDPADRFTGYYLPPEQLGEPEYVGGAEIGLEAVAALEPDLVVHAATDETADALSGIAPTAVFDLERPGGWQAALEAVGAATDRSEQAEDVLADFDAAVAEAREELAPVVERYRAVAVLYPQYRGGAENFLLGEDFSLAGALPQLGFEVVRSPDVEESFPGVQQISPELYSTLDVDVVLALGTIPWQETTSAPVLQTLGVPVVGVPLDEGQPAAGPLTSPDLLRTHREVLVPLP